VTRLVELFMDAGARVLGLETPRMRSERLSAEAKHAECVEMITHVNDTLHDTIKKMTTRDFNQWNRI